jgi:hypothetical protein
MVRGRPAGARITDAVRAGAHAFLPEAAARALCGYAWPQPASSAIVMCTLRCVREAVVISERANVWMTTSENGEHDRISSVILV